MKDLMKFADTNPLGNTPHYEVIIDEKEFKKRSRQKEHPYYSVHPNEKHIKRACPGITGQNLREMCDKLEKTLRDYPQKQPYSHFFMLRGRNGETAYTRDETDGQDSIKTITKKIDSECEKTTYLVRLVIDIPLSLPVKLPKESKQRKQVNKGSQYNWVSYASDFFKHLLKATTIKLPPPGTKPYEATSSKIYPKRNLRVTKMIYHTGNAHKTKILATKTYADDKEKWGAYTNTKIILLKRNAWIWKTAKFLHERRKYTIDQTADEIVIRLGKKKLTWAFGKPPPGKRDPYDLSKERVIKIIYLIKHPLVLPEII